jgi:hypothetical protein
LYAEADTRYCLHGIWILKWVLDDPLGLLCLPSGLLLDGSCSLSTMSPHPICSLSPSLWDGQIGSVA